MLISLSNEPFRPSDQSVIAVSPKKIIQVRDPEPGVMFEGRGGTLVVYANRYGKEGCMNPIQICGDFKHISLFATQFTRLVFGPAKSSLAILAAAYGTYSPELDVAVSELRLNNNDFIHYGAISGPGKLFTDTPETGKTLVGYKKVITTWNEYALVKLQFDANTQFASPHDSYIASKNTCYSWPRKFRASHAKVVGWKPLDADKYLSTPPTDFELRSMRAVGLPYHVGEMFYPDFLDPSPHTECSHGLHFFLTEREALAYRY